jgi:hypothetical protein
MVENVNALRTFVAGRTQRIDSKSLLRLSNSLWIHGSHYMQEGCILLAAGQVVRECSLSPFTMFWPVVTYMKSIKLHILALLTNTKSHNSSYSY